MKISPLFLLLALCYSLTAFAAGQLEIVHDGTLVYDSVSEDKQVIGELPKGKMIQFSTYDQNTKMYALKSKSGRTLWISKKDVKIMDSLSEDVVEGKEPKKAAQESKRKHFSYDLGGSTGTHNGRKFFEANLGLDWHILTWFVWRNSLFYKKFEGNIVSDSYGLDSTLRGEKAFNLDKEVDLNFFAGAGYRFISTGQNAPVAEAGGGVRLGKVTVSGQVKKVYHSLVKHGTQDETIYGLTFSGATSGWF
jgi:hypothetical protein